MGAGLRQSPADHEAGAMVFRHAGGIAAVVSAPHRLLVYRPVRRAPPHHATQRRNLYIFFLFPGKRKKHLGPFLAGDPALLALGRRHHGQERQARKARQVRARAGGGLGVKSSYTELVPRQRAGVPGVRARDCRHFCVGRARRATRRPPARRKDAQGRTLHRGCALAAAAAAYSRRVRACAAMQFLPKPSTLNPLVNRLRGGAVPPRTSGGTRRRHPRTLKLARRKWRAASRKSEHLPPPPSAYQRLHCLAHPRRANSVWSCVACPGTLNPKPETLYPEP